MKIKIEDLDVYFPFEIIYKEQYEYMVHLKQIIDAKGHGLIEMPTGTGKTVSLFSLALSYKLKHPDRLEKIVYCTRTLSQLEKAIEELKAVEQTIIAFGFKPPTSTAISARRTLCINPEVNVHSHRDKIDAECKRLTKLNTGETCGYYDNYKDNYINTETKQSTFNIEDLLEFGHNQHMCPYYTARSKIPTSDVIVCNYPYVLDEKVSGVVLKHLTKNSMVIMDEAHNIDDVCIDSKTIKIDKFMLDLAHKNLETLKDVYNQKKEANVAILEKEYKSLLKSVDRPDLQEGIKKLSDAEKTKLMPGNIRKATHFFSVIKRLLAYLNNFIKQKEVLIFTPETFLHQIRVATHIDEATLAFSTMRLNNLLEALQFAAVDEIVPLTCVIQFGELLASYKEGFRVIFEPYYDTGKTISPMLQLVCLDSTIAMGHLLNFTDSVVLTSGTLSPMEMYAKILGIKPYRMVSVEPNWLRNSINPLIISKASDQSPLTSEFIQRGNTLVSRNYGELLLDLAKYVPDGIVTFFPSYSYMEEIVTEWKKLGIIENFLKHKLLFIETKDQQQTTLALQNYKFACERGRGGIFLCVARGKVAEGVDFKNYLGRCALVIGIPFQYTKSRALICRTEFLEKHYGVTQKQFVVFDAMKQTAQCLGRVVRGKMDYGIMVLADRRFTDEKLAALPKWIRSFLKPENTDLQLNLGIALVKKFFVEMAKKPVIKSDFYYTQNNFI